MKDTRFGSIARPALFAATLLLGATLAWSPGASAASAAEIARDSAQALKQLQEKEPKARALGEKAVAVLVFPKLVKAGMLVGGENGDGALSRKASAEERRGGHECDNTCGSR